MLLSPCEAFTCQLAVYTRMSILRWPAHVPVSIHVTDLEFTCLLWAGYDEKGCRAEHRFIIHAALWKAKGHDVSESPFDLMYLHPLVLKGPKGDSLTRYQFIRGCLHSLFFLLLCYTFYLDQESNF